jgi:Gamma-glutamyltranspeptidase
MVSCSQPLAAEAGLRVLQAGGNAADAAVAVAAALGVTEPCSTGTQNRRSLLPCMSIYLYVYIRALLYVSLSLSLSLFITYTNNLCTHRHRGRRLCALLRRLTTQRQLPAGMLLLS